MTVAEDIEVCECGHEVAEHYDIDHGGPCAVCDCDEFVQEIER